MRETHGHVYVYQTYGMYHCLNFTTDKYAPGAVLIRAVEPTAEIEKMKQARGQNALLNLTNGPGKVCQAFGITTRESGSLIGDTIKVYEAKTIAPTDIIASPRIGISQDTHLNWRFFLKNSPFLSG